MMDVEERLRQAMAAEAERAKPSTLRPLLSLDRPPASQSEKGWMTARLRGGKSARRLLVLLVPLTAAAAASAVIAGVFAAGQAATSSRPGTGNAAAAASLPPFYVTLSGKPGHAQAVVRGSRSGARLSSVPIPLASGAGFFSWITAGNDRMYALAAAQGTAGEQFFLLRIAATGRSAKLTKLPIKPPRSDAAVTGIALSPDGEKLAVALETGSSPRTHGILEVASTRTGATRSWTEHSQYGFPFDPAWASHGRQLGFGWYNHISTGRYPSSKAEVRLLDPTAPGHRLLAAEVIVPEAKVPGAIQTALLTPDGHTVVASIYRATSSGHGRGTVVVRIVAFSAATGRIIATGRRLAIPYRGGSEGSYGAEDECQVLSVDPSGQNTLAQCKHFGRLAGHRFTALPGKFIAPGLPAAAW